MRYGTLPLVRETGGLKDTVEPYNEFEKKGTGSPEPNTTNWIGKEHSASGMFVMKVESAL